MADTGINAIEKGIKTALGAAGLIALVPATRHYNMDVDPAGDFPAVVFSLIHDDREAAGFSQDAGTFDYLIKGVVRGNISGLDAAAIAGDIATQLDAIFHRGTLTATGYTPYGCIRQRRVRYTERDQGRTPYVHSGAIYRFWIQG